MRAAIQPRLIRLRDAPDFFGMDKNRFNAEIRPRLTEIRIGRQGRAFDRLEMEAAADQYKQLNGFRPPAESPGSRTAAGKHESVRASRRSLPSVRDRNFVRSLQRIRVRPASPPPRIESASPTTTALEMDKPVPDDSPGNERPAAQWRKPWDNEESPAS